MNWRSFFEEHRVLLADNYPGLTLERFLREAQEIGGDGEAFLEGVPFAYQLGYAEFAHIKLKVTPDVLIPRLETEQLFELVSLELKKSGSKKRLLDLGCGPGSIGLALAREFPKLQVTLTDISASAIKLAQDNAGVLNLVNTHFIQSNLFQSVVGLYDIIVTNPPYIPESFALSKVHPKTHQFEPALALYVPDKEYEAFFRRIFLGASQHLSGNGLFYMEGHEEKLQELSLLAASYHLRDVKVENDLTGRPRFLTALAPNRPIG